MVAFVEQDSSDLVRPRRRRTAPTKDGELDCTVACFPRLRAARAVGANNGMPLALRTALWGDLADFLAASGAPPVRRA